MIGKDYQRYNRAWRFEPGRAAILVIDMQRFFQEMAAPVVPRLRRLIEWGRRGGIPIVYTQHGHSADGSDLGVLGDLWHGFIRRHSDDWRLIDEIAPADGDLIVNKTRDSAFHGTIHELTSIDSHTPPTS